jgi:hypothetical protein
VSFFGLSVPQAGDFADICKYDARAGRLFKVVYDRDTRAKTNVDVTLPPPRFAVDFGSIQIGYIRYSLTGPDYRTVPEGQPIPKQPDDRDEKGGLAYRAGFKLKLYGKILDGLREWSSTAGCVLESVDDLYHKFKAAPEAATGQIPIVELARTIPMTIGKGTRQTTVYTPCFAIIGWTDRTSDMGDRTVPIPKQAAPAEAKMAFSNDEIAGKLPVAAPDTLDDVIPF